MTWTKLGDSFADELDDANLSPEAFTLHVAALCYSMRLLTDGRIRKKQAQRLYSLADPEQAIQDLIEAGYWIEHDDCYEIVNFLEDQRSAETVRREQVLKKERQARWLDKKRNPEASTTNPSGNGHKKRDASQDASRDGAPAQPRPALKERGGDGGPAASPGGSASAPPQKKRPPGTGLIDIQTLLDGATESGDENQVQAQVGRITYDIELADSWYDDKKDRYIPECAGIWLSQGGIDETIDEADWAANLQEKLYSTIGEQLQADANRKPRAVVVDGCLAIGIRSRDADYWLAKLEEVLITDEVQDLAQAVVETAKVCIVPFQVSGLKGAIRSGPCPDDNGEPIEGRTIVWAAVTAYGPGLQTALVEQLHVAIGQQVLNLIGDRPHYRAEADTHTVAFSINSEDADFWFEKFAEAINTDQVRAMAQEVFSMTTSRETTPEASR